MIYFLYVMYILYAWLFDLFFSSRRRHTRCALVTEFRRVLFRSHAKIDINLGKRGNALCNNAFDLPSLLAEQADGRSAARALINDPAIALGGEVAVPVLEF